MYPLVGYKDVGEELLLDNRQSPYLKHLGDANSFHNLEGYLHRIAGTHGASGRFHLEVEQDIAFVSKRLGMVQTTRDQAWSRRKMGRGSSRTMKYDDMVHKMRSISPSTGFFSSLITRACQLHGILDYKSFCIQQKNPRSNRSSRCFLRLNRDRE